MYGLEGTYSVKTILQASRRYSPYWDEFQAPAKVGQ